jgi:hypothetical protein
LLDDVDANADVAVVAARENGLYVYDLTLTPPTPVAVSSHGFRSGQWATLGTRNPPTLGADLDRHRHARSRSASQDPAAETECEPVTVEVR